MVNGPPNSTNLTLIVAGGRDFDDMHAVYARLDSIHSVHRVALVVSGGCRGADALGERWAADNGVPVKLFPADWKTHGKAAGPMRNRQMAEFAHASGSGALALFPGGRGTESMRRIAEAVGLVIFATEP